MPNPDFSNAGLFKEMVKLKRRQISKSARARTKKFKTKGTWLYPFALERKYAKNLKEIMRGFTSLVVEEVREKLQAWLDEYKKDSRQDAFPSEFANSTEEWRKLLKRLIEENPDMRLLITHMGFDISEQNQKQWNKITKPLLDIEFVVTEPWELQVVEAWSELNLELIKSLSEEYIKKVSVLVSEGVQTGRTWNVIMKDLLKMNKDMTERRAELIARDQIGKLHGMMSERRQTDAGISMYKWITVGDERVRGKPGGKYPHAIPSHWEMDGKVCRWDDPTVYSDDNGKTWKKRTGKMPKVHPGMEIQCRCSSLPFFDDIIEEADEIIKEEEGRVR